MHLELNVKLFGGVGTQETEILNDTPLKLALSDAAGNEIKTLLDDLGAKNGVLEKDIPFKKEVPVKILFFKENVEIEADAVLTLEVVA